jgi:hypothetical protein
MGQSPFRFQNGRVLLQSAPMKYGFKFFVAGSLVVGAVGFAEKPANLSLLPCSEIVAQAVEVLGKEVELFPLAQELIRRLRQESLSLEARVTALDSLMALARESYEVGAWIAPLSSLSSRDGHVLVRRMKLLEIPDRVPLSEFVFLDAASALAYVDTHALIFSNPERPDDGFTTAGQEIVDAFVREVLETPTRVETIRQILQGTQGVGAVQRTALFLAVQRGARENGMAEHRAALVALAKLETADYVATLLHARLGAGLPLSTMRVRPYTSNWPLTGTSEFSLRSSGSSPYALQVRLVMTTDRLYTPIGFMGQRFEVVDSAGRVLSTHFTNDNGTFDLTIPLAALAEGECYLRPHQP